MERRTFVSNCQDYDDEDNMDQCYNCKKWDNANMVKCDSCGRWFHFRCAGVGREVEDEEWSCLRCIASSVSGLNKVRMDLGNLQKTVTKLAVENNKAKKDMAGLKESNNKAKKDMAGLKESVVRLTSESEESNQVLGELEENVNSLNAQAKNNLPQASNNLPQASNNLEADLTNNNVADDPPAANLTLDQIADLDSDEVIVAYHLPIGFDENFLKFKNMERLLLNRANAEIVCNFWKLICQNNINEFIQIMVNQSLTGELLKKSVFKKMPRTIYLRGSNLLECWKETVQKKFGGTSEAVERKIQDVITTMKNTKSKQKN